MQFWLPFVSAPCVLLPGSCHAERLFHRVRLGGRATFALSPEECGRRQRAYATQREEWRALHPPREDARSFRSVSGVTGWLPFNRP